MNGWYCLKCQRGIFPKIENRGVETRPYCPHCDNHVFFCDFDYLHELNFRVKGHVCIPNLDSQLLNEQFMSGELWKVKGLTENYPFVRWILNYEQLVAIRARRIS